MRYKGVVIRPPSEAGSYILQVTYGCSHNTCTFCPTYKGTRFSRRDMEEILEDIEKASRVIPDTERVFLADGNAMCLPAADIVTILKSLSNAFGRLERVGIYANGRDILEKSDEELEEFRRLRLGIVYMGLESGDDEVLRKVRKRDSSGEMIEAVSRARENGMEASVIVLLGLAGEEGSQRHAILSGKAVSSMNPDYLSALTLMVVPGTRLFEEQQAGSFRLPTQRGMLDELFLFLGNCHVDNCVFRSNHASNYLPLKGMLSRDRKTMLESIDMAIQRPEILRPETLRGL
ncbi:MAG: radical SAM protein [Actinomycetota bacterium]|nr:radical SAM protein [Actinomycetota bacterium]